jgi:uncharacterized protein
MKHRILFALTMLVLMSPAGTASAASFNCNYAQLPAEVAICNSPRLQDMDQQMASLYFRLSNNSPGWMARQIRSEQRAWLGGRNACGYDQGCLRRAYRNRINQLENWADQL